MTVKHDYFKIITKTSISIQNNSKHIFIVIQNNTVNIFIGFIYLYFRVSLKQSTNYLSID